MFSVGNPAPISVEEYLAGELLTPIKHEYVAGRVYALAGARNVHGQIASSWALAIGRRLDHSPCRTLSSDTKVRIREGSHTSFYYPDGMVVCEPNAQEETFQDRPVILAEVLSKSTRRVDELEKRDAYLSISTLAVYMLIETDRPEVTLYRRSPQGFVAETHAGLAATIPLPEIQAELPLAELYARVDFQSEENDDEEA